MPEGAAREMAPRFETVWNDFMLVVVTLTADVLAKGRRGDRKRKPDGPPLAFFDGMVEV